MKSMERSLNFSMARIGAAMAIALVGFALMVQATAAQSPPSPPSRFVGTVRIDGQNAQPGTVIEARIGNTTCGVTTVFSAGSESRYTVDSPAIDPAGTPNCGADGSAVNFYVAGKLANETGTWRNYQLNTVNLTVSSAAATPSTPGAGATPTRTPAPPTAGTGTGTGSANVPLVEVMLVAAALGLAGMGLAARSRRS